MIKLGTKVTDSATGLTGMLTHMQIEMDGFRWYNFQPCGINPETGQPVKRFWVAASRIQDGVDIPDPDIPLNILGTKVEDTASGFAGMAVGLCVHISGCIHVTIQPPGALPKTGDHIDSHDFDIRRVKGEAIPVMTDEEREHSQKVKPSPSGCDRYQPADM